VSLQQTFGFGHRMAFSPINVLIYFGIILLVYLSAWLLAAITEHRTAWFRKRLLRLFGAAASPVVSPVAP
jgi:hypothetical protein